MKATHATLGFAALAAFVGLLALAAPGSTAAEPVRLAIVPFKVNADRDMSFLRDGIYDMLASRLAWEGRVAVLGREVSESAFGAVAGPVQAPAARDLGKQIGADWVLFGSLTLLGSSVSIDAKMVDVSGARETLSFYNQSEGLEEVIPLINLIAQDINGRAFDRGTAPGGAPAQAAQASQPQEARPSIYAHPESLVGQGGDRNYSPFVLEGGAYSESPGFWKSRNIPAAVRSMTLGDVDGDGKIETVLASTQDILVFRGENGRFERLAEIAGTPRREILGVDAADVNGNGKEEIFVTAVNSLGTTGTLFNALETFVLEWNGSAYAPIAEKQGWYLRVVAHPARGKILLGQARGLDELFFGPIHELAWSGGSLAPVDSLAWTKGMTVFGFSLGDATNEGVDSAVVFDRGDFLRIHGPGGKKMWKSEETYGGSEAFLRSAANSADRFYLPQRILIADLNANGKYEVIVLKSDSLTGRAFRNFRQYGGGQVVSLSWNGLGLAKNWHTRKASGYFSDLALGDIDNDGKAEIAVAVVRERKNPMESGKSAVIAYDLDTLAAEAAQASE